MPCLSIKLPENKGEVTHVLAGERITIGRRPDNTIQIVDRTVSGHHAELIATNGHYRLHDLGSTNLTCVDGQPVTDYHLHLGCKVSFGTVECLYSPDVIEPVEGKPSEMVPTRAELEFLRRENLDLQAKLATQQKQIDILSSARLMTKETAQLGVAPDAHRRISEERDALKVENGQLKRDVESLKADLVAGTRDRDATRQAWITVKAELAAANAELTALRGGASPNEGAEGAGPRAVTAPISPDAHRSLASVLTKAPALLDSLREALQKLSDDPANAAERDAFLVASGALHECTNSIKGHPVQHLASSIDSLIREIAPADGPLEASAVRTLSQAVELTRTLLDPKHLKRVKDLTPPRALVIDDDQGLLATVSAALDFGDITARGSAQPGEALALLREEHFDLVLLDIGLPGISGIDVSARIREIDRCQKMPIVFLTVSDDIDHRAQSSLNGGNDFLGKPFNIVELTLKVRTWIYRSQFGLT